MNTMTRITKRIGALFVAVMLVSTLIIQATAATITTGSATLSPSITIMLDGTPQTFFNAAGRQVHPIVYNNSTYLPLRAIGETMKKNVNWDQSTLTVSLSGTRSSASTVGTRDLNPTQQTISVQVRPDFTILLDGVVCVFTDAQGNTVYPILHDGTTYLPVRAIGELMGKSVDWDSATSTVLLSSTPTSGSLVTDADSFNQTPTIDASTGATPTRPTRPTRPTQPTSQSDTYIGEAKAKSIALSSAGLTDDQVVFIHTKLDFDSGRQVYDVEFYANNYQEYDYEIDAYSGAVLRFDYDAEGWSAPQQDTSGSYIGEAKAKSIALGRAGLSESQVRFIKTKLNFDDGRWEYEIEFVSGTWEYDFEIDAYSGAIRSYEKESIYD